MYSLRQLVYPPRCALCDAQLDADDAHWCASCSMTLRRIEADFGAPHLAHAWFDRARSAYPFEGRLRDALHGLKYEQRFDLVRAFADVLEDEARRMDAFDVIMPVPLHPKRLRSRGYNQAALIAKPLARKTGVACDLDSLVRARDVGSQVGRELDERLKAVKGIFAVRRPERVKGRRILIVDDVLTTGATVNECARTLKKADATSVFVLTVARTL